MTLVLAIIAGLGIGAIFERGDFCFHSTWRGLIRRPRQMDLFRAYLLALLIGIPLVQGMILLGWIEPWIPPFAWQANVLGGLLFGVGMVVASSCVTGLFYKSGHGMLGALIGLAAWALGDVVTYLGPLAPIRESLNASPITVGGESATALNMLGPVGVVLLLGLALVTAVYLIRSPRRERGKLWNWLVLGIATGLFMSLAWLLAREGGSNYTYGTSGVPSGLVQALLGQRSGGSIWIPVTLVFLIPGATVASRYAGTFWLRGETARRYAELAGGGLLMGIGAGIAGGCNLGHSLVGVPLLSLGSITTTMAMIAGLFLAVVVRRLLMTYKGQLVAEG
ncbi:MAG: YeeE/YedE family protein [Anaerolineaceae bacterium]|nr:MAG: YeeE/YedE family protein [Anaerolineaceae bacterium]